MTYGDPIKQKFQNAFNYFVDIFIFERKLSYEQMDSMQFGICDYSTKEVIDSVSTSISLWHSIAAHHRNYPYSKESATTNTFKHARARSVAYSLTVDLK